MEASLGCIRFPIDDSGSGVDGHAFGRAEQLKSQGIPFGIECIGIVEVRLTNQSPRGWLRRKPGCIVGRMIRNR